MLPMAGARVDMASGRVRVGWAGPSYLGTWFRAETSTTVLNLPQFTEGQGRWLITHRPRLGLFKA